MRRLTGLDAAFLYLETPSNHMHVGSTAIFDPTTVLGRWSYLGVTGKASPSRKAEKGIDITPIETPMRKVALQLSDRSFDVGVYRLDGSPLENNATKPDYDVDITPPQYFSGVDPQLDKAIEVLLKQMK